MSDLSGENWFSLVLVTPGLVSGAKRFCGDLGGIRPRFKGSRMSLVSEDSIGNS